MTTAVKLVSGLMWFFTVLFIVMFFIVLYWILYPYDPLIINNEPFPIMNENKELRSGEYLSYHTDTCRNETGEVVVIRVFKGDTLVQVPVHTFYQEKKECLEYTNSSVVIPRHLPEGKYILEITSLFRVNPLRSVSVKTFTEEFLIVK